MVSDIIERHSLTSGSNIKMRGGCPKGHAAGLLRGEQQLVDVVGLVTLLERVVCRSPAVRHVLPSAAAGAHRTQRDFKLQNCPKSGSSIPMPRCRGSGGSPSPGVQSWLPPLRQRARQRPAAAQAQEPQRQSASFPSAFQHVVPLFLFCLIPMDF